MRPLPKVRGSRRWRRLESGQATVEFAAVLPIFMLVVLGIVDYGTMFNVSVTMTDSVRVAARYATTHPSAWSYADPAPLNTIQGQIQATNSLAHIVNDDAHINIVYLVVSGSNPVQCGYYSAQSRAFVATNGYTQSNCLLPGTLIKITVGYSYSWLTPLPQLASNLPFGGIGLSATATMMEEQ